MQEIFLRIIKLLNFPNAGPTEYHYGPHTKLEPEFLQGVQDLGHAMLRNPKRHTIGHSLPSLHNLRGALVFPSPFLNGQGNLIMKRHTFQYVPRTSKKTPLDGNFMLRATIDSSHYTQHLKDLWNDCVCDVLAALNRDVIFPFKSTFRICWFTPPGGEVIPFGLAGTNSQSAMDCAISSYISSLAQVSRPVSGSRLIRRRLVVFQGYSEGLSHVKSELSTISKGATIHKHPQSSLYKILNNVNRSNFHYAGHGTRYTLQLGGQEVSTGAQIAKRVSIALQRVAYLSNCGHDDDDGKCGDLSLSDALLQVGYQAVIKTTARVKDEVAATVAAVYYREMSRKEDSALALSITLNKLRIALSVYELASFVHCGGHTI